MNGLARGGIVGPGKLNLKFYQGASYFKRLTWYAAPRSAGIPRDLTGCTARMQIRPTRASPIVLLELTTENGRLVLGGTAGTIEINVAFEDTAAMTFDCAVYDLEVVLADATVQRVVRGNVHNSKEVTR
jgi:hypothetical protein